MILFLTERSVQVDSKLIIKRRANKQMLIFVDMRAIIEESKNNFLISTDTSKLDVTSIHQYLSAESYWAQGIPINIVKQSITNSLCFGVYENTKQIGFARMISDFATFAYLADVYILSNYRGQGLSKWLMQFIMKHPDMQGLRRYMLATKDAHGLYAQFGFIQIPNPETLMQLRIENCYLKINS